MMQVLSFNTEAPFITAVLHLSDPNRGSVESGRLKNCKYITLKAVYSEIL